MSDYFKRGLGIRKPHLYKWPHTNIYICIMSGTFDEADVGPIRAFGRWWARNHL